MLYINDNDSDEWIDDNESNSADVEIVDASSFTTDTRVYEQ